MDPNKPRTNTGIENGDCVFFKQAKKSSSKKAATAAFQGHGFGVFLGHVPAFGKDPSPFQLLQMMGQIGFLTFDDVAEFAGDEVAEKCVKAFEDKYYGKVIAAAEAQVQAAGETLRDEAEHMAQEILDQPEEPTREEIDDAIEKAKAIPKLLGPDGRPMNSHAPRILKGRMKKPEMNQ